MNTDIRYCVLEIKKIWASNKRFTQLDKLNELISYSSTNGEIFSKAGAFFKKIKENNEYEYYEAKRFVDLYLELWSSKGSAPSIIWDYEVEE